MSEKIFIDESNPRSIPKIDEEPGKLIVEFSPIGGVVRYIDGTGIDIFEPTYFRKEKATTTNSDRATLLSGLVAKYGDKPISYTDSIETSFELRNEKLFRGTRANANPTRFLDEAIIRDLPNAIVSEYEQDGRTFIKLGDFIVTEATRQAEKLRYEAILLKKEAEPNEKGKAKYDKERFESSLGSFKNIYLDMIDKEKFEINSHGYAIELLDLLTDPDTVDYVRDKLGKSGENPNHELSLRRYLLGISNDILGANRYNSALSNRRINIGSKNKERKIQLISGALNLAKTNKNAPLE
jgi:hypothetical protein